ncbi:hypothetical protein ABZ860_33445 [Microbispora sp. NPDC046973]|uniref:hypothetical protein n=1 Tax=Microbispora sp. NPDC046973 TaxID=3155022 RepID=UPI0033C93F3D
MSTTPATLRGTIDGAVSHISQMRDLTVTADGSMVIVPVDDRYDGWDTTSLTKVRTYASESAGKYPNAVALSPDGEHLAGGFSSGVTLYDTASAESTHAYTASE